MGIVVILYFVFLILNSVILSNISVYCMHVSRTEYYVLVNFLPSHASRAYKMIVKKKRKKRLTFSFIRKLYFLRVRFHFIVFYILALDTVYNTILLQHENPLISDISSVTILGNPIKIYLNGTGE